MTAAPIPAASPVAVVGCGAMGVGIAQVAALAGHPVALFDTRPDAAARAAAGLRELLARLAARGKLSAAAAEAAGARFRPVAGLDGLASPPPVLVVEAIVEDLEAKRSLLRQLETLVPAECLLATNTSSFSITALAAGLAHPERVVGMHFFNPVPLMELVEIVSGLATGPGALAATHATAIAWGKTPVCARSTPGFIVNRVARPFYGEALRLLTEGAADAATLDALLRDAGGFRMGPFELMDLIGLDVNFAVTRSVFDACFGDRRYTPSLIQQEMVQAGFLGRKSGRGYFAYGDNAVPPAPVVEPAAPAGKVRLLEAGALDGPAAALRARLAAHLDPAARATLALTDGRTAARRAAEDAIPNLVLVDHALDFAAARRVAVAPAAGCDPDAYRDAVGALQAAGFAVSRLRDLPGLALLRTVAMLVNEAADAVHTGVASAGDVDTAMRKGVNYPRGPLAWGDAIGVAALERALEALHAHYGEDRYRVSPYIRQAVWESGRLRGPA